MKGTVPQKVGRLLGNLVSHPRYVPRYFAHNVLNGKWPLDLELPWFSYAAIDFLEKYFRPNMELFEFGSGGSTLFFARRCKSVTSVEDNARWSEIVAKRLASRSITNVRLHSMPVHFTTPEAFENSDYLKAVQRTRADVIVVDGAEWTQDIRPLCFRAAEEQIGPGGIIVVDDSWRYRELRQANRAHRVEVFESVGPARIGVTSTDVYFY